MTNSALDTLDWHTITPNTHGDWVNQRDDTFATWPVLGAKKPEPGQLTVFASHSLGVATGRDAWCYSYSQPALVDQVQSMITQYDRASTEFTQWSTKNSLPAPKEADVTRFLTENPHLTGDGAMSWNSSVKQQLARSSTIEWSEESVRVGAYRPFCAQNVYFNKQLNERRYQLPSMFPTLHHDNIGIVLTGAASHFVFTPFITDLLPNLHTLDTAQFFPRWTYEKVETADGVLDFSSAVGQDVDEFGYRRVDNITDDIAAVFADTLGGPQVSKDDIFYYVYGQLHDPGYRVTYAADLKKMLPHIPPPASRERFDNVAHAGRQLAELHIDYENVEPYPLDIQLNKGASAQDRETWRVAKMKWARIRDEESGKLVNDTTTIIYNPKVTIAGIPAEAEKYLLGSRSALGWIIDRYQVKTDKASGIVNDPNDWCDEVGDPRYIVDLIAKVTTVAVETNRIVASLNSEGSA